jgi:hypothetical protein
MCHSTKKEGSFLPSFLGPNRSKASRQLLTTVEDLRIAFSAFGDLELTVGSRARIKNDHRRTAKPISTTCTTTATTTAAKAPTFNRRHGCCTRTHTSPTATDGQFCTDGTCGSSNIQRGTPTVDLSVAHGCGKGPVRARTRDGGRAR